MCFEMLSNQYVGNYLLAKSTLSLKDKDYFL